LRHPVPRRRLSVNNLIPDWNNLVYRDQWQAAIRALHDQQFSGIYRPHLSPPCEAAHLNIDDNPVMTGRRRARSSTGWHEVNQPGASR
jgi:glutamate synthase (NADPH/NADH) small chain